MPKGLAIDDDMVRGRRKRSTRDSKRSLLTTLLLRRPKDTVAIAVALAAVTAILVNALLLQAGRHPAPMFEQAVRSDPQPRVVQPAAENVNPLPRPRPVEARNIEPTRADDPVGALVRSTSQQATATMHPEAGLAPNASARVAAVQRALTDYGYGQLKPTGTIGADTQAAIQRFERERKLPITGQISERLVHELGLATGKPIP